MNIVQITPGAGAMYCGLCIRDNALVGQLRKMGHEVTMVPLYLPFTLDQPDESANTPVFFGGINVYLEQKSSLFRRAPKFFHDLLASRPLLKWAAGKAAARTRPEELGELTLSMLRGEDGNQARELDELIGWLKTQPRADVICLSTVLLLGMARRLKSELKVPIVCMLQGEDVFLDGLPEPQRAKCWQALRDRAAEIDLFVGTSRYFADLMAERLQIQPEKTRVLYNGINLEGYEQTDRRNDSAPILGYFARMCRDKGLDTLVEAYILLREGGRLPNLRLHIGGSCGPGDESFVNSVRDRLKSKNVLDQVAFMPNPNRTAKLDFLRSLSVFSVPARYGEAFGLYVIEALAAGVPVVLPRLGAFPEIVEATGGGELCEPGDAKLLADAIERLLLDRDRLRVLGENGRREVFEKFSAEAMARGSLEIYKEAIAMGTRSPADAQAK